MTHRAVWALCHPRVTADALPWHPLRRTNTALSVALIPPTGPEPKLPGLGLSFPRGAGARFALWDWRCVPGGERRAEARAARGLRATWSHPEQRRVCWGPVPRPCLVSVAVCGTAAVGWDGDSPSRSPARLPAQRTARGAAALCLKCCCLQILPVGE